MSNHIHIYQHRHIFKGDDYIGKYDVPTRSIRLREEFADSKNEVGLFFMSVHGIQAALLVGDEEVKRSIPLQEFPEEILALINPYLGDLTPALIDHARENFSAEEFHRRYGGRVDTSSSGANNTVSGIEGSGAGGQIPESRIKIQEEEEGDDDDASADTGASASADAKAKPRVKKKAPARRANPPAAKRVKAPKERRARP